MRVPLLTRQRPFEADQIRQADGIAQREARSHLRTLNVQPQPAHTREGKRVRALRVRDRLTRGRLRAGHGGVRIIRNVSIGAREGFRGIGERTIHDSDDKVGDELVGSRARAL